MSYLDNNGLSYFWEKIKTLVSAKYTKPSGGIPASDIASGVIPSKTSDLTNDSGYLTLSTLPKYDGSVT